MSNARVAPATPAGAIGPLHIAEEWGDAVGREYHARVIARDPVTGIAVGGVDLVAGTADVPILIKYVEVLESYRRRGVATQLYDYLVANGRYGTRIRTFGSAQTADGQAFRARYDARGAGAAVPVESPLPIAAPTV